MNIYELELHQTLEMDDPHLYNTILRVPGGWIYRYFDMSRSMLTSCFVPFNNEFYKDRGEDE
jgi:hypothetical protein